MNENENTEVNSEGVYSNTISINSDGALYINANSIPIEWTATSIDSINGSLIESRPHGFSTSTYKSLSKEDIVFLDMKIENKENYIEITQTFIDKKNYKEIIKKFKCHNISETGEAILSFNNERNLNLRFERIYNETEYRKDI